MVRSLILSLERLSPLQMALLLALVAEALFLVRLGDPNQLMFDEVHYVPAARDIFGLVRRANEEHPLLAKWLIGLSMALFGETPAGWRALSTVAGTATMLAIYAIGWRLSGSVRTAATAALLALLNQMLFVQARIAMLDVYAGAFLLVGLALIVFAWDGPRTGRKLAGAGIAFGLAVGCKWSTLPFLAATALALLLLRWRNRGAWPGVSLGGAALRLGGTSLLAYAATFLPAFFYAQDPLPPAELIAYQADIFNRQIQPLPSHTYQSVWWQWPLILRPIWYLYERVDGIQRGVLLVGNPAIMWGGLVALALLIWAGLRDREPRLLVPVALWTLAFAVWIVIPKKIGFYYYYYLPGLFLPLALALAFDHENRVRDGWVPALFLTGSFGLFVYFYPIISAAALPNDQAFLNWMWLPGWP